MSERSARARLEADIFQDRDQAGNEEDYVLVSAALAYGEDQRREGMMAAVRVMCGYCQIHIGSISMIPEPHDDGEAIVWIHPGEQSGAGNEYCLAGPIHTALAEMDKENQDEEKNTTDSH